MKRLTECKSVTTGLLLAVMVSVCLLSALPTTASEPTATTTTYWPIEGNLTIIPLPKVGETAEIVLRFDVKELWEGEWWTFGATSESLQKSAAWIEVWRAGISGSYSGTRSFQQIPMDEITLTGITSWEGNAVETRVIELKTSIRLPSEGIWYFKGYFVGNDWTQPIKYHKRFAVAEGLSLPYTVADLRFSPLEYLLNRDNSVRSKLPPDEQRPVYLELDMDHPPLAGEEATLTYIVLSPFQDIESFNADTIFYKRVDAPDYTVVPATDIVVRSDLGWGTDAFGTTYWKDWETGLSMGERKEVVHTITFPETGEWKIYINGRGRAADGRVYTTRDYVEFTITEDKSYYGWQYRDIPLSIDETTKQTTTTNTDSTTSHNSDTLWWWIGGGVLVVAGILVVVLLRKRGR